MSLLRIRAAEILGALISKACPELDGNICSGPSCASHKQRLPSVAIIPISFKFSPDQESEHKEIGDNRLVINAGRYDALFQIRVGSKNNYKRAELEDTILSLFFMQEGRPGILVASIADCHDAIVSYELDQSVWRDEEGFSDKWFSTITINVVLPVLVERGNVFSMDEIRICSRVGVSAEFSEISTAIQECIAVDEDGSVTMSTPPA